MRCAPLWKPPVTHILHRQLCEYLRTLSLRRAREHAVKQQVYFQPHQLIQPQVCVRITFLYIKIKLDLL